MGKNFFQSSYGRSDCALENTSNGDIVLNNVIQTCPNTVWVVGDNNCTGATNLKSTIHLRQFGVNFDENLGPTKILKVGILGVCYYKENNNITVKLIHAFSFHITPFLNSERLPNGTIIYTGIIMEMLMRIAANVQFKSVKSKSIYVKSAY